MSGLHANTGEMSANGNSTIEKASEFANELRSLQGNIDNLMSIWKGPAANSFSSAYQEQANNFNQFQALLNELGEKIVTASNTLNAAEEEASSEVGNLF